MREFVHQFHVNHVILNHSVPFESYLDRRVGSANEKMLFEVRINSADRIVQLIRRYKSSSLGVDVTQLKKVQPEFDADYVAVNLDARFTSRHIMGAG
jgi:hypothetical protein